MLRCRRACAGPDALADGKRVPADQFAPDGDRLLARHGVRLWNYCRVFFLFACFLACLLSSSLFAPVVSVPVGACADGVARMMTSRISDLRGDGVRDSMGF